MSKPAKVYRIALAAVLMLALTVPAATALLCSVRPEPQYAARHGEVKPAAQTTGRSSGSYPGYLDYRDRSVPLLVW